MSEKRFKIYHDGIRKFESNRIWGVKSETNSLEPYMTFKEAEKCCDLLNEQQSTIEHLKKRLYDFEKRKIIEESEIDEDVIPKVKLLRTELFGEKYD